MQTVPHTCATPRLCALLANSRGDFSLEVVRMLLVGRPHSSSWWLKSGQLSTCKSWPVTDSHQLFKHKHIIGHVTARLFTSFTAKQFPGAQLYFPYFVRVWPRLLPPSAPLHHCLFLERTPFSRCLQRIAGPKGVAPQPVCRNVVPCAALQALSRGPCTHTHTYMHTYIHTYMHTYIHYISLITRLNGLPIRRPEGTWQASVSAQAMK